MREFDALCLTPVRTMAPEEIKALREREQVSQPVFASYLNVRKEADGKWERGEKRPDGPSLKLPRDNQGERGAIRGPPSSVSAL